MTITYKFNDGTESTVEVSEEIGNAIIESRKAEHADNEKQRYHCVPIPEDMSGNNNYTDPETIESNYMRKAFLEEFNRIYDSLTEAQKRRVEMLGSGLTMREIARQEGVNLSKIQKTIAQVQKKFEKFRK